MIFTTLWQSFLALVYPPLCLHCRSSLEKHHPILCENCLSLLELLDPAERCIRCFSLQHQLKHCEDSAIAHTAVAFDYIGPAVSLVKQFKYSDRPDLAEVLASYLVMQLVRLQWNFPDIVIPVPISFMHRMVRGYNQSALLAESVARAIERPMVEALVRHSGDYSQAGLSRVQREQLTVKNFALKKGVNLQDKNILLVDDVLTTGTTLQQCAHVLLGAYPRAINALTVCKATHIYTNKFKIWF